MSHYIFVISCCNDRYKFRVKPMLDSCSNLLILYGVYVLSMLFDWCPSRILYEMMVSFNSTMVNVTSGAGAVYPSGPPKSFPSYLVGFILLIRSINVKCLVDHCFSFDHCTCFIVCSATYDFWLPLWYLQTFFLLTPTYSAYIILIRLAWII